MVQLSAQGLHDKNKNDAISYEPRADFQMRQLY